MFKSNGDVQVFKKGGQWLFWSDNNLRDSVSIAKDNHVLAVHTESFDWFLSGLEWILNLEFCLQKLWYFTRNYHGISDLGLILPHFEFFSLCLSCLIKIFIFRAKNFIFDQAYQNTGLKIQNVAELSLDLIFCNNFW